MKTTFRLAERSEDRRVRLNFSFPQCTEDDIRLEHTSGAVRYVCDAEGCGREGTWHPTRTVEGKRLAIRDHTDHVRHMEQGPNGYCTHGCPHLRPAPRMCPCGLLAAAPGDRYCEPCRDGVNNQ